MRKARIILLYMLGAIPLFLLLVAGATQTRFFRDRLRSIALTGLDSLLLADVRLGELHGNLVSGFSLDSVEIRLNGRNIAAVDRIDIAYDPLTLPTKTISLRRVILVHPVVTLERPREGEWNINRIIRPTPVDSSTTAWNSVLDHVEIIDGYVSVVDSSAADSGNAAQSDSSGRIFHYNRFALSQIELTLSARLNPERTSFVISSLSLNTDTPGLALRSVHGSFDLAQGEATIDSLHIQTLRSDIFVAASLGRVDLLKGVSLAGLRRAPVTLTFRTNPISTEELKQLLPPVGFLAGDVTTDLQASGEFGNLSVNRLDVGFGKSSLHLTGDVRHLHEPNDLQLDVALSRSVIWPGDIPALMPPFDLPDYSALGVAGMTMAFKGSPLDFRTEFNLSTESGQISSPGVTLKIGGAPGLAYTGEMRFEKIDLAPLLRDTRLLSQLTGNILIEGEGVSLGTLASHASLNIDSSMLRGLPLTETRIALVASRRSLQADGTVSLGGARAELNGELHAPDGQNPSFRLDGEIASLNLEQILRDSSLNSDLTMKVALSGTGKSWNTLNGTATLTLGASRFRDYTMERGDFAVTLDQRDVRNKYLRFESTIADIALTGQYDIPTVVSVLPLAMGNIASAAKGKFAAKDSLTSLKSAHAASSAVVEIPVQGGVLDAKYRIVLKDLQPLSAAAGRRTFNGAGEVNGTIVGRPDNLSMTAALRVDNFFYGTADSGVLIENGRGSIELDSLKPVTTLTSLALRVQLDADKVMINRTHYDDLSASLAYDKEIAAFRGSTRLNGDFGFRTAGSAKFDDHTVSVEFDSLEAGYQGFVWNADPGALLRYNATQAIVRNLVLHSDSQKVVCTLVLGPNGALHGSVDGSALNLDDLRYVTVNGDTRTRSAEFAGSAAIHAEVGGTLAQPVYTGRFTAEGVSFRGLPFGRINGTGAYAAGVIESHVRVHEPGKDVSEEPVMTVDGSLPVDLRITHDGELPDRAMDLQIVSRGVQMNILDPLLPTFDDLNGVMTCNVDMRGSLHHPTYRGTIGIHNCTFVFVPNNIAYSLEGSFHPTGDRIAVDDCVIRNVGEDQKASRQGLIHIAGDLALRDLKPGDFNLSATGQLLVVKETTRKSALEVYGNLFVEIGPGPLTFTGEVDNSLLKGALLIRNSSLVFPPSQQAVVQESPMSVPVRFVNDTALVVPKRDLTVESKYLGIDSTTQRRFRRPVRTASFMDGLRYDLDIETAGGNSEIRLIFNSATNEELVATMDGKFNISQDGKHWIGDLTISRAYYNFFKRFDATGSLRYTGDFMNPDLDIIAKYQGTRTLASADSTSGTRNEKVVVNAIITGTRLKPKIDFAMTIDDVDYMAYNGPKSNDIQSDAIQFIVAGTFPLTTAQREEMRSTVGQSVLTGATSMLTGRLSEFLQNTTGFIKSVEVNVGTRETTELRLSGTAWDGYWQYSGTILNDPFSNASLSILYSFGTIFKDPSLRNLMFELERRVDPVSYGQVSDLKRINSARIFYRFSF